MRSNEAKAVPVLSGRLSSVGLLNVIACIAVVVLHCSLVVFAAPVGTHAQAMLLPGTHEGAVWIVALAMQCLGIFACPVFFMVSGMNLLGYRKRYPTSTFFSRRVARVGGALLMGSVVCYVAYGLFPQFFEGASAIAESFGLVDFVKRALSNTINDTYWFLFATIYLYVLTPLLSLAAERRTTLEYAIGLCLLVGIAVPLAVHFGIAGTYLHLVDWPLFANECLLYYLLGYYIKEYRPGLCTKPLAALGAFVVATLAMFVLSLVDNGYFSAEGVGQTYLSYWVGIKDPLCVVQAVSLFCLALGSEQWLRSWGDAPRKVLESLSAAALGIYLIQYPVLLSAPVRAINDRLAASPVLAALVHVVVVYLASFVIVTVASTIWSFVRSMFSKSSRSATNG